jgi:phosphopantetheinyl transferase (holo-ACP synthase)
MIVGIGTDCCELERIADAIERRGDRFLVRVFTHAERAAGAKRPEPAAYFASPDFSHIDSASGRRISESSCATTTSQ